MPKAIFSTVTLVLLCAALALGADKQVIRPEGSRGYIVHANEIRCR